MVTTPYTERDVYVRDLKLHYQEWGDPGAPAVLMLHGFGVSGHMFDEFALRMQDRYRLIALDQRGHGDSDWSPEGDYSRDAFVNDVEGFREALGLERFILIGHSMGGLNSVAYTVQHPAHVRALVLVDVGPESAKEGVDNIVRFTRGPDELDFEEFVQMTHHFNPRRSIENIRERMRHRLKQLDSGKWTWKFDRRFREPDSGLRIGSEVTNDESWQLFRSVTAPTLIVRGGESDVLTQETAERAAREMQRARLVVVPGAGHSVPGDNPDDFTAAVQSFLTDLEAGRLAPSPEQPLPLAELVEIEESRRRRGPGTLVIVAGALAGVATLVGAIYFTKKRRSSARRAEPEARPGSHRRAIDVERARQRTADLASELAAAGRSSAARARARAQEVDLDRARAAATDVLHSLGEQSKAAPVAVRAAARKVDRKKLKKRSTVASRAGKAAGSAAVHVATIGAMRLLAARNSGKGRRGSH
ncbi:MAG: alpha/beta hydrolase [Chloroflexi bacterium]|nr:alpha/beta hydrolase [Chloroflexota bacterium]